VVISDSDDEPEIVKEVEALPRAEQAHVKAEKAPREPTLERPLERPLEREGEAKATMLLYN
jgi:hypothetical protein